MRCEGRPAISGWSMLVAILLLAGTGRADTGYVAQNGQTPVSPFTSWETAASNIQDAVALPANTLVLVSNGTYGVISQISLTNVMVLRSVNGAAETVVRRASGTTRIFNIATNAVIDGFTIRDGNSWGISMATGTVQNCIVICNSGTGTGAGISMSGRGTVSNCVIACNTNLTPDTGGGAGIYMGAGGLVVDCVITGNAAWCRGGGIWAAGNGTIRNCLIARNRCWQTSTAASYGGGGIISSGCRIENCTIVSNSASSTYGGGILINGPTTWVTNTISCFNDSPINHDIAYGPVGWQTISPTLLPEAQALFGYSCASELTAGTNGNINTDPEFMDAAALDFRLRPGSPCMDSGTNQVWMTGKTDLAGNARIQGNAVDMGAYEFTCTGMPFLCNFRTASATGNVLEVTFTPYVSGTDTNIVWYGWDFTNTGSYNLTGTGLPAVTNVYSEFGAYSVRLVVSNALGNVTSVVKTINLYTYPTNNIAYVSTNGLHQWPYHTWARAATNIQDAVNVGTNLLVLVSNGVYEVTNQILITNSVVLRSVNGVADTVMRRASGTTRILCVSNNATVDSFTIRDGYSGSGAGIYMTAGTVKNCLIVNHTNAVNSGGGIYLYGGTISNCLVVGNSAASEGGGVFMVNPNAGNAVVVNCIFTNNTANRGGGVASGGTTRNCLIMRNSAAIGGGISCNNGTAQRIENCTIVSNTSPGGGVIWLGGAIPAMTNTIVYLNSTPNIGANIAAVAGYSCSPSLSDGVNGNTTADPLFQNASGGDYRLSKLSPCINAGANQNWMTDTTLDLDGKRRVVGNRVDMGAFEREAPPGTMLVIK